MDIQINGSLSVSGSVTVNPDGTVTFNPSVGANLATQAVVYDIPVASAGSGNWSSLSTWSSGYLDAAVGTAGIQVIAGVIQGIVDPNKAPTLTIDTVQQAVRDFTQGPTDSTTPITLGASLNLSDFVPGPNGNVPFDTSAAISPSLTVPVKVVFDPIILAGDSITVDQANVKINKLTIEPGASLQTGDATNGFAGLTIDSDVTNGGLFDVRASTSISIGGTLVNLLNATFSVESSLKLGSRLVNEGLVEASTGGNLTLAGALANVGTIQASGGTINLPGNFINKGVVEANSSGAINLTGQISGGTLLAMSGGTVQLNLGPNHSASLIGVTLGGDGTGSFVANQTDNSIYDPDPQLIGGDALQGVTIQAGVTFTSQVFNNTALGGTISNSGTLITDPAPAAEPTWTPGAFVVDGPVTLTGGGTMEINGGLEAGINYRNYGFLLRRTPGSDVLTNVDNTIDGAGSIDVAVVNQAKGVINGQGLTVNGPLTNQGLVEALSGNTLSLKGTVANSGTIEASGGSINVAGMLNGAGLVETLSGGVLTVGVTSVIAASGGGRLAIEGAGIANSGILEAASQATLLLANATINDSAGGAIEAVGGGHVELQGTDILGGALETFGSGIVVTNNNANILDGGSGHAVTLIGTLAVADKTALTIQGAIANHGAILLEGGADTTDLLIGAGGAILSGGGIIGLADHTVNRILAASAATLTNIDNRIAGAGVIGNANLTLFNGASGLIVANGTSALTIYTGANVVTNAGQMEGGGAGGMIILSALNNTGTLLAYHGNLTVAGAVTGAGAATISGGTLAFGSNFSQNVNFTGANPSGILQLARSQGFADAISGFSHTSGTQLDLRDIGFVGAGEATYSGNASGGVLTVSDGVHTAHITLSGNYVGSTFVASSDGHGGVSIVDPPATTASQHRFVAAMSAFGSDVGGQTVVIRDVRRDGYPLALSLPRFMHFA